VFNGDEFMTLLSGFDKGHVQADFKFLGNHDFFLGAFLGSTVYGNDGGLFNGFAQTLQGMTGFVGRVLHLINFGGGNVFGVNPADPFAVQVDLQHDLGGRLAVFVEKLLQHPDHELHGCEVVVEHDHLVHLWGLGPLGSTL
jgi:hypothetical protein